MAKITDEKKCLKTDFSAHTANIQLTVIHQWQASQLRKNRSLSNPFFARRVSLEELSKAGLGMGVKASSWQRELCFHRLAGVREENVKIHDGAKSN